MIMDWNWSVDWSWLHVIIEWWVSERGMSVKVRFARSSSKYVIQTWTQRLTIDIDGESVVDGTTVLSFHFRHFFLIALAFLFDWTHARARGAHPKSLCFTRYWYQSICKWLSVVDYKWQSCVSSGAIVNNVCIFIGPVYFTIYAVCLSRQNLSVLHRILTLLI